MTENEAKSCIQGKLDCMNKCDVFDCKNTDECDSCGFCYSQGNFGEQKKAFEMAIQALEEIQAYRSIGTVEEFKALKENKRKCEDCAGCTNWKCDCANERDYALNEFANYLHEKAKGSNGLRLSSETRSWTHPCIFDYLKEFKEEKIYNEET